MRLSSYLYLHNREYRSQKKKISITQTGTFRARLAASIYKVKKNPLSYVTKKKTKKKNNLNEKHKVSVKKNRSV